jgi:hypothetical protein
MENPKDEAIGGCDHLRKRDCKKLRITIYELRLTKSETVNPKSEINEVL